MSGSGTRGFTLFMAGLSGAGKSTICERLCGVIEGKYKRPVTMLDGDIVREMLSSGLAFPRADRKTVLTAFCCSVRPVTRAD